MTKKVSAAQAKAHLSDLMAKVAYGGEQYVIERRGKPLAALVSVADLERLRREAATSTNPRGALALAGAWSVLDEAELDALMADIYAERARDAGRPVSLEA